MKIVENVLGATAEAVIENPLIAGALCVLAIGYGVYKVGEAAVHAAPVAWDATTEALGAVFRGAMDEVSTLINGKPDTAPAANVRTIPIHVADA